MAKKATKAKNVPATVDEVIEECAKKVRSGLGRKRVSAAARTYWETEYRASITHQLKQPGANWTKDRLRVLPVAKKLGKVAAALSTGNIVLRWAAEAASVAVQADPGCPGVGSGGFCDI